MSEEFKKTNKVLVLPSTYTIIDAYFQGLDDQQQKDSSKFVKDLKSIKDDWDDTLIFDVIKKWEEKL